MTSPSKGLFVRTITLSTLALVSVGCRNSEPLAVAPESAPVVPADQIVTITQIPIANTVRAQGVIEAQLDATLSAKATGRVQRVLVREGDRVSKGQLLVEIDDQDLSAAEGVAQANTDAARAGLARARTAAAMEVRTSLARRQQAAAAVQQAEAGLAAARNRVQQADAGLRSQERAQAELVVAEAASSLRLAERELDRRKRLVEMGAIAQRELDLAQNQFESAQARHAIAVQSFRLAEEGTRSEERRIARDAVRQAESAVRQAQAALREADAAQMSVQLRRDEAMAARAQVGQASANQRMAAVARSQTRVVAPFDGVVRSRMVDPGSLAAPGTPLLAIQGGEVRLRAAVPESELSGVKVGEQTPVRVDALNKTFWGRVVEIVPQGSPGAHTFDVRYRLDPASGVRPGMFAVALLARDQALRTAAPTSALGTRDGLVYVRWVDVQGQGHRRLVTAGQVVGEMTEILSGLKSGDRVDRRGPFTVTEAGPAR